MGNSQGVITDASDNGKSSPAAYLPFRTFVSSIEALEHGIPKQIDRAIWRSQSGVVQTQIMMALRFLGFVNQDDAPTALLHEYVEQKDRRKEIMVKVLKAAYAEIIKHDLTKMTPKMLDDAFDAYKVSGDTKRKAVTFFLKAAKFAEVPMHSLLSSQVRNTGPRGKRRKANGEGNGTTQSPPSEYMPSEFSASNTRTVNLHGAGSVTVKVAYDPFALSVADRDFVFKLIDMLKAYPVVEDPEGDESEDEEDQ